jgi:hypothetical protein
MEERNADLVGGVVDALNAVALRDACGAMDIDTQWVDSRLRKAVDKIYLIPTLIGGGES